MTEQKKKVKACKDTDYLFISAYLRAKEPQLLTEEKAVRMLSSSVQEAARTLEGCGYADVLTIGLDKALNDRRAAVFSEVEALAPKDGVVSLFRMRYDYHNAKTIVKAEAVGIDPAPLLSGAGRADAQALKTAYETGESGSVPQAVLTAMQAARDALSRSADPQLADLILDRAYFAEYHETAAQVGPKPLRLPHSGQGIRADVRWSLCAIGRPVRESSPVRRRRRRVRNAARYVPTACCGIARKRALYATETARHPPVRSRLPVPRPPRPATRRLRTHPAPTPPERPPKRGLHRTDRRKSVGSH